MLTRTAIRPDLLNTSASASRSAFVVRRLVLDTGERLPCLVDRQSLVPPRLPMRWAARYRRYHTQSSTLHGELQVLGQLYGWGLSRQPPLDVDATLLAGGSLDARSLEALAYSLRTRLQREAETDGSSGSPLPSPVDTGTYDWKLGVVRDFLDWAADPTNRGGSHVSSSNEIASERARLGAVLISLRVGARSSSRFEPLSVSEVRAVRAILEPAAASDGGLIFPPGPFAPAARLRNWIMVEVALELGLRRGEILKLRLDSLPRGRESAGIAVRRLADDPYDARRHQPAVKTAERVLPASQSLLLAIHRFLTSRPSAGGRVSGRTPYLFTSASGAPLSYDAAGDVIQAVGNAIGVRLSWHRLRHTWAEALAERLLDAPDGAAQLQYLGGWTHPLSALRYIQHAIARRAGESLRTRQADLYRATVGSADT